MIFPPLRIIIFLYLLSFCYSVQGQNNSVHIGPPEHIDTAILNGKNHLRVAEQRGDTTAIFNSLVFLAGKFTLKHNYTETEKCLQQTEKIMAKRSTLLQRGILSLEKGKLKKYGEAYAASLNNFLDAQQVFEKIRNWHYLSVSKVEIAEFYRKIGKYDQAREFMESAFSVFRKHNVNDTALLIRLYNRTAAIDNESGQDIKISIGSSKKALDLARLTGDKNAMAISMNELGFTYKNMKKNDSSEYYYRQAEDIWFSLGYYFDAIHVMNNRIMLYAHNRYPTVKIISLYEELINKVTNYKIDYPLDDAYKYLYIEHLEFGDTAKALKYFEQYHNAAMASEYKKHDINIHNITEKYQNEKIKNANARLSGELNKSNQDIAAEKREKINLLIFLLVLVSALILIVFLAFKLRKSNKELKIKNKEKDSLIQEIHHRVKNNLQFISSLVNMQIKASENKEDFHTLSDASRRINAMALVHEMLYNQDDDSGISVKLYLEELIASLSELVHSSANPVVFETNIKEMNFTVQESISLGMITSEIVSNSIKHAFTNINSPMVKISLEEIEPKKIRYTISDNGNGFNQSLQRKDRLGLRLIDIFSRQLKGKYEINGTNGFEYDIVFNIK